MQCDERMSKSMEQDHGGLDGEEGSERECSFHSDCCDGAFVNSTWSGSPTDDGYAARPEGANYGIPNTVRENLGIWICKDQPNAHVCSCGTVVAGPDVALFVTAYLFR